MFDFIKKMFGEGKIKLEVICDDGQIATVKVPYIGDINTLDEAEFFAQVKNMLWVEHNVRAVSIKITGMY